MADKLKVGWFSFSCSEDSTIVFTELLNDYYKTWKRIIDFKSIQQLQKRSEIEDIDVAFVEGAITSEEQEEKLRKIRLAAKRVVAVGACAITGLPAGQRNQFDEKTQKEIEPLLFRFQYAKSVKKVSDVVEIDDKVPGCPMNEKIFLQVLEKYLIEFQIV